MASHPTGVLLVNTGTPDVPTVEAVRAFLADMLSDPMLVSAPRPIWNFILQHFILPRRPARTVEAYRKVWTDEGAPFLSTSLRQRELLQAELDRRRRMAGNGEKAGKGDGRTCLAGGDERADEEGGRSRTAGSSGQRTGAFHVELAMRYGNPSIDAGLRALADAGCERLVVLPLYPQYVRVCAGTVLKETRARLAALGEEAGWHPKLAEVESFYEQPAYREALAESVRAAWERRKGGKLVISFHSTLLADIRDGDPYERQTRETAEDLARRLGLADEDWMLAYQSRFDSRRWLAPFTDEAVEILGATGINDVCVATPGFVADNIETRIELGEGLHDSFLAEARRFGTAEPRFTRVPALGEHPGLVAALADAVEDAVATAA